MSEKTKSRETLRGMAIRKILNILITIYAGVFLVTAVSIYVTKTLWPLFIILLLWILLPRIDLPPGISRKSKGDG